MNRRDFLKTSGLGAVSLNCNIDLAKFFNWENHPQELNNLKFDNFSLNNIRESHFEYLFESFDNNRKIKLIFENSMEIGYLEHKNKYYLVSQLDYEFNLLRNRSGDISKGIFAEPPSITVSLKLVKPYVIKTKKEVFT